MHIQNELTNSNIRKVELETELSSNRAEIRDHKQRAHDLNIKLQELQRQLQDIHTDKNRMDDRVHELDKVAVELNFKMFLKSILSRLNLLNKCKLLHFYKREF